MPPNSQLVESFKQFIRERWAIHQLKAAGRPKPWTQDPILQRYRFCNVRREDDTVTRWIADHWRAPHAKDPDLWFAMCVARLVNWPDTLAELDYPKAWDADNFVTVLERRAAGREKVFSGAYIVSTNGHAMPKARYLAQHVLTPLWTRRQAIRPTVGDSLDSFHDRLWGQQGMGPFMAAQVVADVKYVEPLKKASDWYTWAAPGPGSKRGLNVVLGRAKDTPWGGGDKWLRALRELIEQCTYDLEEAGVPRLHAQDYQNCLCEFDKYTRTSRGEGTPRSTYQGV